MGTPDFSRRSWRLKIERAKQHLVELDKHIGAYSDRQPYRVAWETQKHENSGKWRCMFRITERPADELAIIIGDVVHNVRSALNHLAVTLSGNTDGGFPIVSRDPDALVVGKYINGKARQNFIKATRGMNADAVAVIKRLQPYSSWPTSPECPTGLRFWHHIGEEQVVHLDRPYTHYLYMLAELNNADKHRELVTLGSGITDGWITIAEGARIRGQRFANVMFADNAQVATRSTPPPPETEVEVEVHGSVVVAVPLGPDEDSVPIFDLLRALTNELPLAVFGALEPLIRL